MESWKRSFSEKLGQVQARWATRFEDSLEEAVTPIFDELSDFLTHNGLLVTTPVQENGRRTYKFELAEDAYVLLNFRSRGIGEFELSRETFVLGHRPVIRKTTERVSSLSPEWAQREFQGALDTFVELLNGADQQVEQLVTA